MLNEKLIKEGALLIKMEDKVPVFGRHFKIIQGFALEVSGLISNLKMLKKGMGYYEK